MSPLSRHNSLPCITAPTGSPCASAPSGAQSGDAGCALVTSPLQQRNPVTSVALSAGAIAPLSRRGSVAMDSFGGLGPRGSTSEMGVPPIAAVAGAANASGAIGGSTAHTQQVGMDSFGGSRACSPYNDTAAVKVSGASRTASPLRGARSPCGDIAAGSSGASRAASPLRGARAATPVRGSCSARAATPSRQSSPPPVIANVSSRSATRGGRVATPFNNHAGRFSVQMATPVRTSRASSATRSTTLPSVPLKEEAFAKMPVRFRAGDASPCARILCYGDSLTVGYCNNGLDFEPYGRTMANVLGLSGIACEVSICGLSGLTAEDMVIQKNSAVVRDIADCNHVGKGLAKILEDEEQLPDLVLILVGTNDIGLVGHTSATAEHILGHTQRLHEMCHQLGIPTVALTAPSSFYPPQRRVQRQLAALLAEWARVEPWVVAHADCEELAPRQAAAGRFWDPDELHLSAAGQRALGERLARLAVPLLPSQATGSEQLPSDTLPDSPCPTPPRPSPVRPPRAPSPSAALSPMAASHGAPRGQLTARPRSPTTGLIRMTSGGVASAVTVARTCVPTAKRSLSRSQSAGSHFATLVTVQ